MTPRTELFRNCLGVFQGGGCRGAALAGAYAAAAQSGVHFSQVAGTSAGSIIAALIGAGAEPDFILDKMQNLDFRTFLAKAKRVATKQPAHVHFFSFALTIAFQFKLARLLKCGGTYTSRPIYDWMQSLLAELLPDAPRPIQFRALPKPTFIVAADLLSAAPKIWSSLHTPDEDVAAAVQASCSIPGFFQPVECVTTRYVDGGILSNLPTFVFADEDRGATGLQEPILAFQLKGDYSPVTEWHSLELGRRVAGVVVDGAVNIQNRLHRNVYTVTIPTGNVLATDFDKITPPVIETLVASGRKSMETFVRREMNNPPVDTRSPYFKTDEETYRAIVEYGRKGVNEVVISMPRTRWVWSIYPTLLAWRLKGVKIRVLAEENHGSDISQRQEKQRRTLLENLGVKLDVKKSLPIKGFILRGKMSQEHSAILVSPDAIGDHPYATLYSGLLDSSVIELAYHAAVADLEDWTPGDPPPALEAYTEDFGQHLKKSIALYSTPQTTAKVESVPVKQVFVLTPKIREFKLRQLESLVQIFKQHEFELFKPLEVVYANGNRSIVTPPVVEYIDGQYNVIEGNTRLFYCFQSGLSEVTCAVVRNVQAKLPRPPFPLAHASITAHEKNVEVKDLSLFRPIEECMHPY